MLWLTGLIGLAGVGAASFAVVQLQEEPEEDEPVASDSLEHTGNLLDDDFGTGDNEPENLNAIGDVAAKAQSTDTNLTDDEIESARDSLLDASYDDILFGEDFDAQQPQDSAEGNPSDQMLRDIVRDPFGGGFIDLASDHPETDDSVVADGVEAPSEQIMLGDWISEGQPSEVLDYETEKDSLMLVWDDMIDGAEEPQVDVAQDPYDHEVMHVLMNGKSVAEVYGDPELSVSDVTIIPLSSALIVGLEPA